MDNFDLDDEAPHADHMRLAKLRAQSRMSASKVQESEARALAQKSGSLTEELRREQKRLRRAVERAKVAEKAAAEAQQACKELHYANKKLQQELDSLQITARVASDRSSRCVRNLRDTLYKVEVDASSTFSRGQQQVQHLIVLTKRLQCLAAGCGVSSTAMHQTLIEVNRTLAGLGELLTPSPSLLQEADLLAATISHNAGATDVACNADAKSTSGSGQPLSVRRQRPATADANSGKDAHYLTGKLDVLQKKLGDVLSDRAMLQRQCDDLQWHLQHQVGSTAASASSSRLECNRAAGRSDLQPLAEITSLQAEKLQLQQELEALQRSYAASQSAIQLLREDHAEQTSRLAAARAEVLRLTGLVSSLEAHLEQQQHDFASAFSIVWGREAATPIETTAAARYAAQKHLHMQQAWQATVRGDQRYQTQEPRLAAAAALGTLGHSIASPSRPSPEGHVSIRTCAQQSCSPRGGLAVAPAASAAPAALATDTTRYTARAIPAAAQHAQRTGLLVPTCDAGGLVTMHTGTAEEALQQHRRQISVKPATGPDQRSSSVDVQANAAAAGASVARHAADKAMTPAARYSALVADADAALQRLADCRKAAVAGITSGAVPAPLDSPVRASGRTGALRQDMAEDLTGYQRLINGVTRLESSGSASRQLFGSGGGSTGYKMKTAVSGLSDTASAPPWVVPGGNHHIGLDRLRQGRSILLESADTLPCSAADNHYDSRNLRLNELCAEMQAIDGDIQAAEAALQAATARFSSKGPW